MPSTNWTMNNSFLCAAAVVCCLLVNSTDATVAYNTVKGDYELLLTAYQTSDPTVSATGVIPRNDQSSVITVLIGMYIYAVMDFDAVTGKIQLVGSMAIEWQDDIKTITGTTFTGNLQTIFMSNDQIWSPNLILKNSADSIKSIGDSSYTIRYNVTSGYCKWKPRMIINAACTPDMTFYPFDEQTCSLVVVPWSRDSTRLRLIPMTDEWNTADLEPSGIWTVPSTSSTSAVKGGTYETDFKIVIKRKPLFLTIVLVLPILMLSMLTGFLFLLPPGSGSRVGFGMTCFLSFVILLQTLIQFLPEASVPMSLLCYYIITMLMFSAVLSIVNVFLLRMYMGPGSEDVPAWLILFLTLVTFIPCRRWHRRYKFRQAEKKRIAQEKADLVASKGFTNKGAWNRIKLYAKELVSCDLWRRFSFKRAYTVDVIFNTKFTPSFEEETMLGVDGFPTYHSSSDNPAMSGSESTSLRARHVGMNEETTNVKALLIPDDDDDVDDDKIKKMRKNSGRSRLSRQDSEDSLQISSDITWEDIGQILDLFFIVTFVAVQTVFTVFFLVPILARY